MMLGARTAAWAKSGYTARDYVQDGLVGLYDGKEVLGYGKTSESATAWVNCVDETTSFNLLSNFVRRLDGVGYAWDVSTAYNNRIFQPSNMTAKELLESDRWTCEFLISGYERHYGLRTQNSEIIGVGSKSGANIYGSFISGAELGQGVIKAFSFVANPESITLYVNGETADGWSVPRVDMTTNTNAFRALYIDAYCARLYSADKTAAEIAANYAIDKARFGLT